MSNMHKLIIYSLLGYFLLIMPVASEQIQENDTVPDWTQQTNEGDAVNLYTDAKDNITVILFWATWCPYCRALMPYLQQVANEYVDKPVKFYALNVWEDSDPAKYLAENGFTFTLLMIADLVAEDYGVKGTPGLFVIDTKHRVRYMRRSGEDEIAVKIAVEEAIESSLSE